MSTTIDINVTPTFQDVTINTVDNVTVINVNTVSGGIQSIVAGTNVNVDNTDPLNPIVSSDGGGGGVETVTGTAVDNIDPDNPVIDIPTLQQVINAGGTYTKTVGTITYTFIVDFDTLEFSVMMSDTATGVSSSYYITNSAIQNIVSDSTNSKSQWIAIDLDNNGVLLDSYSPKGVVSLLVPYRTTGATSESLRFEVQENLPAGVYKLANLNDIPSIDATPTDGSNNAVSSNGVFDALASKQNALVYRPYRFLQTSQTAHTGTNAETIIATATITANTFNSNDIIKMLYRFSKPSGIAGGIFQIRINTSNTLSGSVVIFSGTFNNITRQGLIERNFDLYGGNLYGFNFVSTSITDVISGTTTLSSTPFNTANILYVFFTLGLTNSADSVTPNLCNITN